MRRYLGVVLFAAVVALSGCTPPGPAVPAPAGAPQPAPATGTWVAQMLVRINAERTAVGAAPLELCARLTTAAQAHSEDQAATGTMSHIGSNGSTMTQRVETTGYIGWRSLAENVAAGYPDANTVMNGWMNSTGHRANLLSASSAHVGLGRATSGSGSLYWAQNFGRGGSC